MREFMDFEEKSVDKAVEKACNEFNLSKDQLKYDIISHGSSGIFGLVGMKKAVIRVTVPADKLKAFHESDAAPADDENASSVSALVDEAFGPATSEDEDREAPVDEEEKETAPEEAENADADRETSKDEADDPKPAPKAAPKAANDTVPDQNQHTDRKAISDWVNGFIGQIIELISPESTISARDTEESLRFDITGGDSARLIGKRGQTLDAIQYLVEKAVYKQFGSDVTVEIDVEGYLDKRRSELTSLASRLAQKAKQTGKPMVINRINAQDRRVVHLSLKDNRHVRTQSVGNGELRKLLILPKKKTQGKGSKSKAE